MGLSFLNSRLKIGDSPAHPSIIATRSATVHAEFVTSASIAGMQRFGRNGRNRVSGTSALPNWSFGSEEKNIVRPQINTD